MNKRGWIRILEATIAVMIVAAVLVIVYTKQIDKGDGPADYFHSLQKQILMDVSSSSDLRLLVLNGDEAGLDLFVADKIPDAFGHYLRICGLGDMTDFCKIDNVSVVADIRDKDVFVEEIIISADLGDGSNAEYDPKKVRLFVWEKKEYVELFPEESMLPDTAEILFVSNRYDLVNRRAEIYSMDANGGNQERITFSDYHHFIMGIDNSKRYLVTSRAEIDTHAPVGLGDEDDRALWIIDLYTGQETRLTNINNRAEGRSFSPDGEWIVFMMTVQGEEQADIYKIKKDGTSLTKLTNTLTSIEGDPEWSYDGTKISFSYLDGLDPDIRYMIKTMDSNGENIESVSDAGERIWIAGAWPPGNYDSSWSPDDEWIVFERAVAYNATDPENFGSGIWHIFKVKSDGSEEIVDLSLIGGHADRAEFLPSYSPDGNSIVFGSIHKADPLENSYADVFKMDSYTGVSIRLTTDSSSNMYPVWIG